MKSLKWYRKKNKIMPKTADTESIGGFVFFERKKMPFLNIKTNGFCNDELLAERAAKLVSETLGKPLKVIAVDLHYNAQMAFNGSCHKKGAWIELGELVCVRLIDLQKQDVAHGGVLLG